MVKSTRKMRTNIIAAVIIILIILVGGAGIYVIYQKQVVQNKNVSPTPLPSPITKFPETLGQSTSPAPIPNLQPVSGSETANIQLGITVKSPIATTIVSSPLTVTGTANVPSANIEIWVKDANGQILGRGQSTACFDTNPCPFKASVVFSQPSTQTGTVEVLSSESSDFLQIIPVRF